MSHFSQSRRAVHPGVHLREELEELGLSVRALARALDVPHNRVAAIIRGERALTADTALRLAACLGTSAEAWLDMQKQWELQCAEEDNGSTILERVTPL